MKIDLDRYRGERWNSSLRVKLGRGFDVLLPKMPNPTNANYCANYCGVASWVASSEESPNDYHGAIRLNGRIVDLTFLKFVNEY